MNIGSFFTMMHSGADNQSPDVARVLCSLCIIVVLFLAVWDDLWRNSATNFVSLGACIAQVLGATGLAIKLKEGAEPVAEPTSPPK